jgi:hypothetical protein
MLCPDNSRYVMFPIKDNTIWQMYKKAGRLLGRAGGRHVQGRRGLEQLSDDERHFISMVLAFFRPATDWL